MEQQSTMAGPVITRGGTSTATVMTTTGTAGVAIHGGTELGSFLTASYGPDPGSSATTAEVTVNPAPGAAFVYWALGSHARYSGDARLQRLPDSTFQATTTRGTVTCGTLASGAPTVLTMVFDGASHTFDVRIDGAASSCSHLPTSVQLPLVGFGMMDASNQGWGGDVAFTRPTMY